jgi:methanesulfonate monooxygenase large subunit
MPRNTTQWERAPSLPNGDYVDNRVYTDEGIFKEERDRIFKKVWLFACHESELPNPHDFRTMVRSGSPLLVIRGGDGVIRTFINSCSHRGALLAREARGNAPRIQCMFHQWTFNDRGDCTGMTRPIGYRDVGLLPKDCGLRAVRTEKIFGLVFVNFDDEAASLSTYLGNALEIFEEVLTKNDLDLITFHRSTVASNWKHYQETNLDLYHEQMHVSSRRTSMTSPEYHKRKWRLYDNGHGLLEPLNVNYEKYGGWQTRNRNVLRGLKPDQFFVVSVFPNLTLIARSTVVRIDTTIPNAINRTQVEWRGLGAKTDSPDDRAERVRHFNQFWGPFGRNLPEDICAVESMEQTVRNESARFSIMARHENLLANDDVMMRRLFSEWQRYLGRAPGANIGSNA